MCALEPHIPVVVNGSYEQLYVTHFGWGVNGLNVANVFYFILQGSSIVIYNP